MEEKDKQNSLQELRRIQKEYKAKSEDSEAKDMQRKLRAQRLKHENAKYRSVLSQELMQELRVKFQNALNKLSSIDTREVASKEARMLIERNNSLDALRIYLACLGEHRSGKSPQAREQEVALLGFIAEIYGDKLLDEPTNPLRLIIRLGEIIQLYFKDLNAKVREAAAIAMCQVYQFSLPKDSQQVVFTFMFEPLNSILASGIDVQAQHAAALTIFKWTELLVELKDTPTLAALYQRTVALFIKLRAEFYDLISALGLLIEKCGFQPIVDNLIPILNKLVQYLKLKNAPHVKVEACKLLGFIAKRLCELGGAPLGEITIEVLEVLKESKTDKLPMVQAAAREAYKLWELEKKLDSPRRNHSPELVKDSLEQLPPHKLMPDKIVPNNFKAIRNLAKIQKEQEKLPSIDKTTQWGVNKGGYLKRGSGNYAYVEGSGKMDLENVKPSIKDFIKKKQEAISNEDKMMFIEEEAYSPDRQNPDENDIILRRKSTREGKDLEIQNIEPQEIRPLERKLSVEKAGQENIVIKLKESRVNKEKRSLQVQNTLNLEIRPVLKAVSLNKQTNTLPGKHILHVQPSQSYYSSQIKKKVAIQTSSNTLASSDNLIEVFEENFKDFQRYLEKGFDFLDSKLKNIEERLDWAQETILCLQDFQEASHSAIVEQKETTDPLANIWCEALQSMEKNNFSKAYEDILSTGDDIYLLRLMHKSGPCLDSLEINVTRSVINRLATIIQSDFIEFITLEWLEAAARAKQLVLLTQENKNIVQLKLNKITQEQSEHSELAQVLASILNK